MTEVHRLSVDVPATLWREVRKLKITGESDSKFIRRLLQEAVEKRGMEMNNDRRDIRENDAMPHSHLIIIDTETTNKYPEKAKVLEIAAVVVAEGKIVAAFSSLVNVSEECLEHATEALQVNGITREEIRLAPPKAQVEKALRGFLEMFPNSFITSYNISYDYRVLKYDEWDVGPIRLAPCVMERAKDIMGPAGALPMLDRGDYKFPSMKEAAEFFGVPRMPSHRALDDALTVAGILTAMEAKKEERA